MSRVYAELSPEEILNIWQLEWVDPNSMIYKDNAWVYQAIALWAAWTVPTSNGATSAPTFQEWWSWDLKADGSVPMTGALDFTKWSNIASATSTDIWAATWNFVDITWTTTISNFWASAIWVTRRLRFTWILTLTYNATQMILPWNASITTAVWDTATFVSLWSWDWICTSYQKEDWTAVVWWGWWSSFNWINWQTIVIAWEIAPATQEIWRLTAFASWTGNEFQISTETRTTWTLTVNAKLNWTTVWTATITSSTTADAWSWLYIWTSTDFADAFVSWWLITFESTDSGTWSTNLVINTK